MNVTLCCLPHAGGSAQLAYGRWRKPLAEAGIDLLPLELPGRGMRGAERSRTRMAPLVLDLLHCLVPLAASGRPYAFFGHSMGSAVVWELTCALVERALPLPCTLVVSGRNPPHDLRLHDDLSVLDDAEFIRRVAAMGGTPAEVFATPEIVALFLPILRADFALLAHHRVAMPIRPLACDLLFLYGVDDVRVDAEGIDGWRAYTRGRLEVEAYPGGHFYLQTQSDAVCARVAAHLHACLSSSRPPPRACDFSGTH